MVIHHFDHTFHLRLHTPWYPGRLKSVVILLLCNHSSHPPFRCYPFPPFLSSLRFLFCPGVSPSSPSISSSSTLTTQFRDPTQMRMPRDKVCHVFWRSGGYPDCGGDALARVITCVEARHMNTGNRPMVRKRDPKGASGGLHPTKGNVR